MDKLAGETDRSQEKICPELNLKSANKFHTQPVFSCYCGPSITLVNSKGGIIEEEWQAFFWQKMQQGNIFAVKGLGGFHLTCILNQEVIAKLRHRKKRPFKPFVIMCRDLETVCKYCHLDLAAEELLLSQTCLLYTSIMAMRIYLSKDLREASRLCADDNRKTLAEQGVLMINLMGSPGSGKTTLLEHTMRKLSGLYRIAVIEGDLYTAKDAERLSPWCKQVCLLYTSRCV